MVGAAGAGAEAAFRLQAAVRLLKRGRITDATIVSLDERLISAPSGIGFSGWVTTIEVSFTDASGHLMIGLWQGRGRGLATRGVLGRCSGYLRRSAAASSPVTRSLGRAGLRWPFRPVMSSLTTSVLTTASSVACTTAS